MRRLAASWMRDSTRQTFQAASTLPAKPEQNCDMERILTSRLRSIQVPVPRVHLAWPQPCSTAVRLFHSTIISTLMVRFGSHADCSATPTKRAHKAASSSSTQIPAERQLTQRRLVLGRTLLQAIQNLHSAVLLLSRALSRRRPPKQSAVISSSASSPPATKTMHSQSFPKRRIEGCSL